MHAWVGELTQLVHRLLGSPEAAHAELILRMIAVVTLLVTFRLSLAIVGTKPADMLRGLSALVVGVLVLAGGSAAVTVFLLPHTRQVIVANLASCMIPLLLTLLVGVPLQCVMLRAKYVPTMLALATTLAMTMLVLIGARALLGSLYAGKAESDMIRANKTRTENFINRQGQPNTWPREGTRDL